MIFALELVTSLTTQVTLTFELGNRPDRACPLELFVGHRHATLFGSQDFLVAGQ